VAEAGGRINGWKAIASYLGRDRTTAMRWAARHAMPVHRLPGSGASVYAYVGELDAWLAKGGVAAEAEDAAAGPAAPAPGSSPAPRRTTYIWACALAVVAVVGAAVAVPLIRSSSPAPAPAAGVSLPADPRVAATYVQAREDWATRTGSGLRRAVSGFAEVIARDPGFAPAYGGLGDAYLLIREFDALPEREAYQRAEAAANAALAVDRNSAEGHRALGFIAYWWHHDGSRASVEFNRALALDPRNGQTRLWLGNILIENGQVREGLAQLAAARVLDPGSRAVQADYGWALWMSGERARGRQLLEAMAARDPDFVSLSSYLSMIALLEGDDAAYLRYQQRRAAMRNDARLAALLGTAERAEHARGRAGMLAVLAAAARTDSDIPDRGWEATLALLTNDRGRLLALLEAADARGDRWSYLPMLSMLMQHHVDDPRLIDLWRRRIPDPIKIESRNGTI